nr:MAG TPA_asm: hypothetical protein [Caudoviricetes sp.]
MSAQRSSGSRASARRKRRLKSSPAPMVARPTKSMISSSRVVAVNILPSPVRSQCSSTWNSRQMETIAESGGILCPVSQPAIVDCLTPILAPKSV